MMKMKSLLSAAHAAGFVMAPSEEQFHAQDGMQSSAFASSEVGHHAFGPRAHTLALPPPRSSELTDSWLKSMVSSVWTKRATA